MGFGTWDTPLWLMRACFFRLANWFLVGNKGIQPRFFLPI